MADYAPSTIRSYVQIVDALSPAHRRAARSDHAGPAPSATTCSSSEDRRLAVGTVVAQISALRFFCRHVLQRRDVREDLPYPKAATPPAGRAQSRRGPAPDRRREESLSPHLAADLLRRWLAPQRSLPAQGPRHR